MAPAAATSNKLRLEHAVTIFSFVLLFYFIPAVQNTQAFIYVTNITNTQGNDTPSCWFGGQANPCKSLFYALKGVHNTSNATYHPGIFLEMGDHELNKTSFSTFNGTLNPSIQNVTIVGSTECSETKVIPCAFINCTAIEAGMTFVNVSNIILQHLYFLECGALHYSTSKVVTASSNGHFSFAKFRVALYFAFCENIAFLQVSVVNTPGTGVVIYATAGHNVFENCRISFNRVTNSSGYPGGGGLYLEFPYCSPTVHDHCDVIGQSKYVLNTYYLFQDCKFIKNEANVTNSVNETFILPRGTDHVAFGRGGGLSVFFKGNAGNNVVIVNQSSFYDNRAIWGAGIFAEFQDNSTNNTFNVYDSTLESNSCPYNVTTEDGTGGGGTRVGFFFFGNSSVKFNSMLFDGCTFKENTAYFGGGVSFYTAKEQNTTSATNTLKFTNCKWYQNTARVGAALDLSLWHPVSSGVTVLVELINITVAHHNASSNLQSSGAIVGIGAMYIDSIPTQFDGHVDFYDNHHSALAAVGAQIDFLGSCVANFFTNQGRHGGAIALFGSSFIRVHNGTQMSFIQNSALMKGGAIYSRNIGEHYLLSLGNCFIRYVDIEASPEQWEASFYFVNNTANERTNSIYTTTLLPCVWGSAHGPSLPLPIHKVFCWDHHWNYSSKCKNEIESCPAKFTNLTNSGYSMEIFPGIRKVMPVGMTDDLNNNVADRTVFTAYSLDPYVSELDNSSRYIADNEIKLYGDPNTSTLIGLYTIDPRVLYVTVNVTLKECPPGLTPNKTITNPRTECICKHEYVFKRLVQCLKDVLRARLILDGTWIGRYNDLLVASYSPYTYGSQLLLPLDAANLSHHLCGPSHRKGVLCGECKEGFAPSFDSRTFDCVPCSSEDTKYHWIFFFLSELLPQTILFAILILFNVSLTSGPANAFLLFAQVIATSFALYTVNIPPYTKLRSAFVIVYDIWNLNFFEPVLHDYCLSPDTNTATILALEYIVAVYPLILIGSFFFGHQLYNRGEKYRCVYCIFKPFVIALAKLRQKFKLEPAGSVDALTAFLILSYTKFTTVSIRLLSPGFLYNVDGNHQATVMFYDGSIGYGQPNHIPYIVAAIFVLTVFVILPPLVLFMYPFRIFRMCFRWLTCDIYDESGHDGRVMLELKHFLNSFYGCYKDGHEQGVRDLRWFAGVYFLFRIVFGVLHSTNVPWVLQYTLQQLLCTFAILLFVVVKPYKKNLYNYVDGTIFGILAAINALSHYNYYLLQEESHASPIVFAFEYLLIWLPLIYMVAYIIVYWWAYYRGQQKQRSTLLNQVGVQVDDSCISQLEDNHISDNSIMRLIDHRAQQQSEQEARNNANRSTASRSGDSKQSDANRQSDPSNKGCAHSSVTYGSTDYTTLTVSGTTPFLTAES